MSVLVATRRLVIVESPAKAKTIKGYLGPGYEVEASIGHIRDLPSNASEVPADIKDKPWARLAIDVEDDFRPYYVVSARKKSKVTELRKALASADELLLATDEDREGEAIAWHLMELLKPKVPVRRMVFHEITKDAIRGAAENTRELDRNLVDAQETRRIIDRLFGFEVSPVLWRKVLSGLSAGRVQSVATRLVVDRERERIAFRAAEYWDILGRFVAADGSFQAKLTAVDDARVATGADFADDGSLKPASRTGVRVLDGPMTQALVQNLSGVVFRVNSVVEKPGTRRPSAPFMTSTLQQEASRKLRWSTSRTMRCAQSLYENGYITYIRTDSTSLSEDALRGARAAALAMYGPSYVPDVPRRYDRKVKNAQEAHEAIRPAGESFRRPAQVRQELSADDYALYELIWRRTVASQMADAKVATTSVRLSATTNSNVTVTFSASGTVVVFPGFLAAYEEGFDEGRDPDAEAASRAERRLPVMREGESVTAEELLASQHSTQPPARFTEATMVKELETRGIGRPSTYEKIIPTIIDRGYVTKRGTALVPTFLAFSVVRLMEDHFAELVDYNFTARLEEILDQVAGASMARLGVLRAFYYGDPTRAFPGLEALVTELSDIDARAMASFPVGEYGITSDPVTGNPHEIVLRVGKYGPYLERGSERANVGADIAPDELTYAKAHELLAAPSGDRILGVDPESGLPIAIKVGRFGPYVTEVLPEEAPKAAKARKGSLLLGLTPDTVTLADALRILSLPRVVGQDREGREITAASGRFGPYIARTVDGKAEYRSLPDEESLFSVTEEQAIELFAAPKTRRGQTTRSTEPLRVLGADPATGAEITLRDGRYGPYVTDGTTNASLRRADDPTTISLDRAGELLAERRAAGPPAKSTKSSTARKPRSNAAESADQADHDGSSTATVRAPAKKTSAARTSAVKTSAARTSAVKTSAARTSAVKTSAKKDATSRTTGNSGGAKAAGSKPEEPEKPEEPAAKKAVKVYATGSGDPRSGD